MRLDMSLIYLINTYNICINKMALGKYMDFLTEQFKQNWDYIKHQEIIRLQLYRLYVVIISSLISLLAVLAKFSNEPSLMDYLSNNRMTVHLILIFAIVYGLLFIWLMLAQKSSYQKYRNLNSEISAVLCSEFDEDKYSELRNALDKVKPNNDSIKLSSTFFSWLSLPLSITLFIAGVLIWLW